MAFAWAPPFRAGSRSDVLADGEGLARGAVRHAFQRARLVERARCARMADGCGMTLARRTKRLVLRRVALGDLPFFVRIHVMPEVARGLWPEGRPRSAE